MKAETRICQNCKKEFTIEVEDFLFYEKMQVPPPTFCAECRFIRRLLVRNERSLYKRKCDLCGEEKILIFPKDSSYKVYCFDCFFSDRWGGEEFAKDYDFSKPFLEQFQELFKKTPRLGIIKQGLMKNSEYTNRVSDLKNCHLIFASADDENCYYGTDFWNSKDSMDCFNVKRCELCLECIDCSNCSNLKYSQECNSCVDSWFLHNCRNCQNCFGCVNLRNKNYCIYNEQYSKDDYFLKLSEIKTSNRVELEKIQEKIKEFAKNFVVPSMVGYHSVNVSGNWIDNSKNVHNSFNCNKIEEGKNLFGVMESKDVMDYTYWGKSCELMYEVCNIGRQCASVKFSAECWDQLTQSEYCINCFSSSNLFGCIGLRKKSYCIFNKQYTKEEYQELVSMIKKHMNEMPYVDKKGIVYKYGEFFPFGTFPFAYNESIAQSYVPKTKEQATSEGHLWDNLNSKNYAPTILAHDLPENIEAVSDDILSEVIACAHGGKCNQQCTEAFKITENELKMYKRFNLPIPKLCPNCRHYERLVKRQPIKLWYRQCMCEKDGHEHNGRCPVEFETSYSPDRPEIVYCEKCYQREVY